MQRVSAVKYVPLFVDTEQFASDLAAMSPCERERAYDRVNEWFATHADRLRGGSKLQSPETATTVRLDRGEPVETAPIDEPLRATLRLLGKLTREHSADQDNMRAVLAVGFPLGGSRTRWPGAWPSTLLTGWPTRSTSASRPRSHERRCPVPLEASVIDSGDLHPVRRSGFYV